MCSHHGTLNLVIGSLSPIDLGTTVLCIQMLGVDRVVF